MNILEIYKLFLLHPNISTDSRSDIENSIFFCLKGDNFDGNKFAISAIEKGAAYSIVDDNKIVHEKVIYVDNVLSTLQELAIYHRNQINIPVIGITGTNGKTTTKELINAVLSSHYKISCTKGNFNNHIGVPLTILSIQPTSEIAIVEMGANHIGEIAQLCEIADPTHGIITNIGKAHLEGFGTIEGIIKTKKALYDYVINNDGILFVSSNSEMLLNLSKNSKRILYGKNCGKYSGKISQIEPTLSVFIDKYNQEIKSNLIGNFNFNNILSSVSIGDYFNVPFNKIKTAIENYYPTNSRSQLLKTENNEIFLDAYNANPSSMDAAITHFLSINKKNKVIILGDMRELGEQSLLEHKNIVKMLSNNNEIKVFLVGEEFCKASSLTNYTCFKNSDEAAKYFIQNPLLSSYILLKGSRGIKMETIIQSL